MVSSNIESKDSSITFTGHHGALHSTVVAPFIKTSGNEAHLGSGYEVYHVEGKNMLQYTEDDHIDANKRTGDGIFGHGTAQWTKEGDTLTLSASDVRYKEQQGTKDGKIEGVDQLFMGMYSSENKPELDDAHLTLKVSSGCGQKKEELPQDQKKPQNEPAPEPPVASPEKEEKPRSQPPASSQTLASPKKPETSKSPESSESKKPGTDKPEKDTPSGSSFAKVWNYILGVATIGSMFAILGQAFIKSGALESVRALLHR